MKAVILAGGKGTRLYPLTKIMNKHLLPVGQYPMIHYAISKLCQAEVCEIMIIVGKQSAGQFIDFLGTGKEWRTEFTYRIQEEAGGIAQALSLAENFIRPGEKFIVMLGDNLFEDSLIGYLQFYEQQAGIGNAMVLLKAVHDPHRYGVPVMKAGEIIRIEEKPLQPKSNYCVTGIYMYDSYVFDIIRSIQPSERGELEITDVNNLYAVKGKLSYKMLNGWWMDAGTAESLYEAAGKMIFNNKTLLIPKKRGN